MPPRRPTKTEIFHEFAKVSGHETVRVHPATGSVSADPDMNVPCGGPVDARPAWEHGETRNHLIRRLSIALAWCVLPTLFALGALDGTSKDPGLLLMWVAILGPPALINLISAVRMILKARKQPWERWPGSVLRVFPGIFSLGNGGPFMVLFGEDPDDRRIYQLLPWTDRDLEIYGASGELWFLGGRRGGIATLPGAKHPYRVSAFFLDIRRRLVQKRFATQFPPGPPPSWPPVEPPKHLKRRSEPLAAPVLPKNPIRAIKEGPDQPIDLPDAPIKWPRGPWRRKS